MTRRRSATLQTSYCILVRGARPIADIHIVNIKLACITVALRALVVSALRDGEDACRVVELEVGEGDVGRKAEATSTAVRRVALGYPGPGLEVGAVTRFVRGDIASCDILNGFVDAVVWDYISVGLRTNCVLFRRPCRLPRCKGLNMVFYMSRRTSGGI